MFREQFDRCAQRQWLAVGANGESMSTAKRRSSVISFDRPITDTAPGRSFRFDGPGHGVFDEFHGNISGNDPRSHAAREQFSNCASAPLAIVEGPIVDIHV